MSGQPDAGQYRQPTIYDVARLAGVSHQTVHRFLSGFEGIRPTTRERVAHAVAELDYRPNLTARSLTTGRSHRLGALTHEIKQVGPNQTLQGAFVAARQAGYLLDVLTLDMSDDASIQEALDVITRNDLAGILALASTDEMTEAFERTDFRVPAVIAIEHEGTFAGRRLELSTTAIPALVEHLAVLGHARLLYLSGPTNWSAARDRARDFRAAVAQHGLQCVGTVVGDWSPASGFEAIRARQRLGATAVVSANDQMALGAMLALTESGLQVPGDISVTGMDDIPESAFFNPPLTTIRQDFASQGRAAVQQLLGLLTDVVSDPAPLTAQLMVRRSTGPARPR